MDLAILTIQHIAACTIGRPEHHTVGSDVPEGQQVAKGYLQHIKLLAVFKDIWDHSRLNQRTPILSAGLAPWKPPTTWPKMTVLVSQQQLSFSAPMARTSLWMRMAFTGIREETCHHLFDIPT
jgi:hypothetical protein